MKITHDGLVAGERFLRVHGSGFDEGTPDEAYWRLIRCLWVEVFRASDAILELPEERRYAPDQRPSKVNLDKGQ